MRRSGAGHRARVALLTLALTAASLGIDAAPVAPLTGDVARPAAPASAPLPLGIGPEPVRAAYCATPNPTFTGRLTASATSHTAVARITNPNVYGYISNVDGAWACTLYRRYDGVAWNTTATLGTFDWGTIINST